MNEDEWTKLWYDPFCFCGEPGLPDLAAAPLAKTDQN
jgi:hypothetical protein